MENYYTDINNDNVQFEDDGALIEMHGNAASILVLNLCTYSNEHFIKKLIDRVYENIDSVLFINERQQKKLIRLKIEFSIIDGLIEIIKNIRADEFNIISKSGMKVINKFELVLTQVREKGIEIKTNNL